MPFACLCISLFIVELPALRQKKQRVALWQTTCRGQTLVAEAAHHSQSEKMELQAERNVCRREEAPVQWGPISLRSAECAFWDRNTKHQSENPKHCYYTTDIGPQAGQSRKPRSCRRNGLEELQKQKVTRLQALWSNSSSRSRLASSRTWHWARPSGLN